MVLPSGDQDGELHEREPSVNCCNSPAFPPLMDKVYTSGLKKRQRSSRRLEVNAIRVPSGDQATSPSSQSPSVSCSAYTPSTHSSPSPLTRPAPPSISIKPRCCRRS